MKKTLLALSALTLAATANAQSNVTIYGLVDSGLAYSTNGSGDSTTFLGNGGQSGNRLGFRGVEDLGNGKKALFVLEKGFNINDGSVGQSSSTITREFGRQAYVGLNDNNLGELRFGRQYNPIRNALESVNPFEIGLAGNIATFFDPHGERADSAVTYTSPNLGGFTAQALYSLGQVSGDDAFGRQRGISVNYANGPIYVVASYHNSDLVTGTTTLADNGNKKTTMIGGVYNFGVAKAHASFAKNKGDNASGAENLDSTDMMLGVTVPFGASKFLASYMQKNNDFRDDADTRQWSIGYTYDLSKRTNLYASYAKAFNDNNANIKPFQVSQTVVNGAEPSIFNIGVRHKF